MSSINDTTSVTSTSSAAAETLKAKAAAATAAMKAKMEQQALQKAEKEAAKAAEKAEKEAAKAAEKEAQKAIKEAEKAQLKAEKEAEKATQPKRPVGRPKKASSTSSTASESAPVAPAPEHLEVPILKQGPEPAVDPLERIKQLEDEVAEYRTYIAAMQASLATLDSIRKLVNV